MNAKRLRIAFAGTPEIASHVLEQLISTNNHDVSFVLTQPDRPAGRGRKIHPSAVKSCALDYQLPVLQPENQQQLEEISFAEVDLLLVVAYGIVVSRTVINAPKLGCMNIHTSLLPRWRGAAPIQRAIEAGDDETGISFMQMDEGLDTGPIIASYACPIEKNETAGSLHDKLAQLASVKTDEILNSLAADNIQLIQQDDSKCSYAKKISKSEAELDWQEPAVVLERKIRAFNPFPICYTSLNGYQMRIYEADCKTTNKPIPVAKILSVDNQSIDVATSDGILSIKKIQLPGKRPIKVTDFLNSRPDFFNDNYETIS